MSGLVKGVKKVFSAVGKFAKKVLPFALPAIAIAATVGGAFGIPMFAGGFGGTVSRVLGNGILGKAVTFAGYGGLAGGAIGGLTGGKEGLVKGLGMGQMVGAATGALAGAMAGPAASGATGATQASMPGGGAAPGMGPSGMTPSTAAMTRYGSEIPGQVAGPMAMTGGISSAVPPGAAQMQAAQGVTQGVYALPSSGMAASAGINAAAPAVRSGLSEMERVAMITAIGPQIGPAMGALLKKEGDDNPALELERERAKRIRENYGNLQAPTYPQIPRSNAPVERFVYDEAAGRIVRKYV
jgi:hypothetical protein